MGREGRDYWEEQLSEYWDSGLTIQEYSELKELPYESTRRWIRVLEKARQDGAIDPPSPWSWLGAYEFLYNFQQRLSFSISVFNGLQKASPDMRPATGNLAVQFFIGCVRVSDDGSGVISEQTFCNIPGSGWRKVIGYHRWPDSRQSAPQIRLLTLLCPLDQLQGTRPSAAV